MLFVPVKGENGPSGDAATKLGPGPHQTMSMSMEPPFMQQQSQIFVFSTGLANKAADMVQQGLYKSMLGYHMDQPNTKKFLQVFPLQEVHTVLNRMVVERR